MGGKDDMKTDSGVHVPWSVILPLVAGLIGGGAMGGISGYAKDTSDEDIAALRVQIVEMRADIKAIGRALDEVKAIEELAHPRVLGVPPLPTSQPVP